MLFYWMTLISIIFQIESEKLIAEGKPVSDAYHRVRLGTHLALLMRLFDSLFNDACMIFVGFGPTGDALASAGSALVVDISQVPGSR